MNEYAPEARRPDESYSTTPQSWSDALQMIGVNQYRMLSIC